MRREFKPSAELELPIVIRTPRKVRPLPPQWKLAKIKNCKTSKMINDFVEYTYHEIIKLANALFVTLPDDYSKTIFERNFKDDPSCATSMHDYLSSSFYWTLECHLDMFYYIRYDFYYCPFEQALRAAIDRKFKAYSNKLLHWPPTAGNVEAYFKGVIFNQPEQYITTL